jgi:hypothetical protein
MPLILDPPVTSVVVDGAYNTEQDMDIARGSENITSWSQKNPEGPRDTNAIAEAIRRARDLINMRLRTCFAWPLASQEGGAIPVDALSTLKQISEPIASFMLFRGRGLDVTADGATQLLLQEFHDQVGYTNDSGQYIPGLLDKLCDSSFFIDLQRVDTAQSPRAEVVGTLYPSCSSIHWWGPHVW